MSRMKTTITWQRALWPLDSTDPRRPRDWVSTCGTYHIWIQGRPRDSSIEYAAQVVQKDGDDRSPRDAKSWLGDTFTLREAKEACEEHKQGIRRPRVLSYGIGGRGSE